MIRFAYEKKGIDRNPRDQVGFNEVVTQLRFTDLPLCSCLFTLSDMRENPNLARLPRVLVCDRWDIKFSLAEFIPLQRPT